MTTIAMNLETDAAVLPPPELSSATLQDALDRRRSTRAFLPDALTAEQVSALLWAAFGINRRASGGRTAPSAHNWQEVELYVVLAEGAWRYEPAGHRLSLVKGEDLRALTGRQEIAAQAPLNLVYVVNMDRMEGEGVRDEDRVFLAGVDAGCIAQNVYLHCAAAGLGTVARALIDRRALARALGLKPTQRIALAQSVGLPASA